MTDRLRKAIVDVLDHAEWRQRERSGEKRDRFYVVPIFAIDELRVAYQKEIQAEKEQGETD